MPMRTRPSEKLLNMSNKESAEDEKERVAAQLVVGGEGRLTLAQAMKLGGRVQDRVKIPTRAAPGSKDTESESGYCTSDYCTSNYRCV
jgi:hypothetical protein